MIKLTIWWLKLTKKIGRHQFKLTIRKSGTGIKKCLFILPEFTNNQRLIDLLRTTMSDHQGVSIQLLINKLRILEYSEKFKDNLLLYDEDEFTNFNFPDEKLLDRVCMKSYHAVVDLNTKFYLPSAYLVYKSNAPYRIGFQTQYAEHFYNVVLDNKTETDVEYSIMKIKEILNI
mgnify:CR=1 FL=1|tara:strand:- start:3224 stop:3745 length:522 start_codon:yes stop_codon:yes gene_type:complete